MQRRNNNKYRARKPALVKRRGTNNGKLLPGDGAVTGPGQKAFSLRPRITRNLFRTEQIATQAFTLTVQSSIPLFGSLAFNLSDIPAYSNWTALFDQYRIEEVEAIFRPFNSTVANGRIITAIDYDNQPTVTSFNQVEKYQTAVTADSTQTIRRRFKPRTAVPIYNSLSTVGYQMGPINNWIDSAYPDVPHFGLVYALENVGTGYSYVVDLKYTLTFNNVN